MTNGHLIARLLNLDVLIRLKFAGTKDHVQLPASVVGFAFGTSTLQERHELLGVDHLIDFEAASLTVVNCDLHLRLDIGGAHHDTSDVEETSDQVGLRVSHLHNFLLGVFPVHDENLVASLKVSRQFDRRFFRSDARALIFLKCSLDVCFALFH